MTRDRIRQIFLIVAGVTVFILVLVTGAPEETWLRVSALVVSFALASRGALELAGFDPTKEDRTSGDES